MDKILTRKRSIVETIIDPLKNIPQIEHSRHPSSINFFINVVCGLIAFCLTADEASIVSRRVFAGFGKTRTQVRLYN